MKWRDRKQSRNVDDRRASSGRGLGGGRGLPSIGTLMFLWPLLKPLLKSKMGLAVVGIGAALYFTGFNPLSSITGGATKPVVSEKADDERAAFLSTVMADTESVWGKVFAQANERYPAPTLVIYRGGTDSRCGPARAGMGPFYCPEDQQVYVDMSFFDEMERKYGATGDFAQAYVLAHEIGHHIQNMEGTLDKVQRAKQRVSGKEDNKLQVMVELQADCYAGIWANQAQKQYKILEPGDLEEALRAAEAIGDDSLQKKAQGFAIPHTFTHGTSKQRVEWFARGVKSGLMKDCNTFTR